MDGATFIFRFACPLPQSHFPSETSLLDDAYGPPRWHIWGGEGVHTKKERGVGFPQPHKGIPPPKMSSVMLVWVRVASTTALRLFSTLPPPSLALIAVVSSVVAASASACKTSTGVSPVVFGVAVLYYSLHRLLPLITRQASSSAPHGTLSERLPDTQEKPRIPVLVHTIQYNTIVLAHAHTHKLVTHKKKKKNASTPRVDDGRHESQL
jgi:hypothetical protein